MFKCFLSSNVRSNLGRGDESVVFCCCREHTELPRSVKVLHTARLRCWAPVDSYTERHTETQRKRMI
ncbi:son of sevenless [Sarotherodon galilaeus]